MSTAEKILPELYEILLKLKYPGIVQTNAKDIEETVLSRENRLFLLSWLLAQSSVAMYDEFSTNTDESKLIKWYSNMGICNNSDVLMGRVPIQDQIWALKNLLFFMKNVLAADQSNNTANDLSQITDILKKRMSKTINIIPTSCSLGSKLNYPEAVQYLKKGKKAIVDGENPITDATLSKNDESVKKNNESMKNNDESSEVFGSKGNNDSTSQESGRQAAVEKFIQDFDSVSDWPTSITTDSTLITKKSMDDHIDNIHSNMVTLQETLHSKNEVSNFVITEELKNCKMPLDDIIEDIVISMEEVSRLHNE